MRKYVGMQHEGVGDLHWLSLSSSDGETVNKYSLHFAIDVM